MKAIVVLSFDGIEPEAKYVETWLDSETADSEVDRG